MNSPYQAFLIIINYANRARGCFTLDGTEFDPGPQPNRDQSRVHHVMNYSTYLMVLAFLSDFNYYACFY